MQLQQAEDTFSALNVQLVVVTFQGGSLVRAYLDETGFPWPIVIDAQREVYQAYDMSTARLRDLWGPATWWAYVKEFVRGHLPRWSVGDTSQQGGDVLVDPGGVVRFHHVGKGPADRPSIARLLQVRHGAE